MSFNWTVARWQCHTCFDCIARLHASEKQNGEKALDHFHWLAPTKGQATMAVVGVQGKQSFELNQLQ